MINYSHNHATRDSNHEGCVVINDACVVDGFRKSKLCILASRSELRFVGSGLHRSWHYEYI